MKISSYQKVYTQSFSDAIYDWDCLDTQLENIAIETFRQKYIVQVDKNYIAITTQFDCDRIVNIYLLND